MTRAQRAAADEAFARQQNTGNSFECRARIQKLLTGRRRLE
jgi:hypothetical protein